jgi:hypothetical protein
MTMVSRISMTVAAAMALSGWNFAAAQQTAPRPKPAGQGANGHTWHMKRAEVKTGTGWDAQPQWGVQGKPQKQVVALTMMVPVDWEFAGGPISPSPNDCNFTSGRIGFTTRSQDKTSGLRSIPSPVSIWTTDPQIMQSIQQDNQKYGHMQTCKLERPQPLAQKIGEMVQALGGPQATGQMETVPGMAGKLDAAVRQANQQLAQQGAQVSVEAGRIPIVSTHAGPKSEGYLTVMQVVRTDRTQTGATISTIDYPMQVVSFAPAGQYAGVDAMFTAMLDSVWINPEYAQDCLQASANMQHIKLQMKSRISQIQAQMAADNLNAARQQAAIRQGVQNHANEVHASVAANRSAALEHSSQQFSMYMGDQALYHDPSNGQTVQLPSSYNHAWASSTGNSNEYILTDSPSYNPNGQVGSGSWTQMQEIR